MSWPRDLIDLIKSGPLDRKVPFNFHEKWFIKLVKNVLTLVADSKSNAMIGKSFIL